MPPRIGIPLGLDDRGRIRAPRRYWYLDRAYADAVAEAGARALHLPAQPDAAGLVSELDGLLLPGGDDFPPPRPYPGVRFEPVPEAQLAFDRALLRAALDAGLPVLGVCYGMQLLVREHGGGLLYDVASDRPDAGPHRLDERDGRHGLAVEPGTRLAAILGPDPGPVNSLHHQGVAAPGASLRVAARAPDGLIEAVEAEDGRFVLGVQWHPEKLPGAHRERLFGAFARACAGRPGARGG